MIQIKTKSKILFFFKLLFIYITDHNDCMVRWKKSWCNISNTRNSVSLRFLKSEKSVEKTRHSQVFLTDFEAFGYLMKHPFDCWIWLLKLIIKYREKEGSNSPKSMLIRIGYSNDRYTRDSLCSNLMNC